MRRAKILLYGVQMISVLFFAITGESANLVCQDQFSLNTAIKVGSNHATTLTQNRSPETQALDYTRNKNLLDSENIEPIIQELTQKGVIFGNIHVRLMEETFQTMGYETVLGYRGIVEKHLYQYELEDWLKLNKRYVETLKFAFGVDRDEGNLDMLKATSDKFQISFREYKQIRNTLKRLYNLDRGETLNAILFLSLPDFHAIAQKTNLFYIPTYSLFDSTEAEGKSAKIRRRSFLIAIGSHILFLVAGGVIGELFLGSTSYALAGQAIWVPANLLFSSRILGPLKSKIIRRRFRRATRSGLLDVINRNRANIKQDGELSLPGVSGLNVLSIGSADNADAQILDIESQLRLLEIEIAKVNELATGELNSYESLYDFRKHLSSLLRNVSEILALLSQTSIDPNDQVYKALEVSDARDPASFHIASDILEGRIRSLTRVATSMKSLNDALGMLEISKSFESQLNDELAQSIVNPQEIYEQGYMPLEDQAQRLFEVTAEKIKYLIELQESMAEGAVEKKASALTKLKRLFRLQ